MTFGCVSDAEPEAAPSVRFLTQRIAETCAKLEPPGRREVLIAGYGGTNETAAGAKDPRERSPLVG